MKKYFLISYLFLLIASTALRPSPFFGVSLVVTVRDGTGNTVPGAHVRLYQREEDYLQEVNAVQKGVTDKKGIVKFKKLSPIPYFILAEKGDINNAGGGEQISALTKGKVNKVTVIIQ